MDTNLFVDSLEKREDLPVSIEEAEFQLPSQRILSNNISGSGYIQKSSGKLPIPNGYTKCTRRVYNYKANKECQIAEQSYIEASKNPGKIPLGLQFNPTMEDCMYAVGVNGFNLLQINWLRNNGVFKTAQPSPCSVKNDLFEASIVTGSGRDPIFGWQSLSWSVDETDCNKGTGRYTQTQYDRDLKWILTTTFQKYQDSGQLAVLYEKAVFTDPEVIGVFEEPAEILCMEAVCLKPSMYTLVDKDSFRLCCTLLAASPTGIQYVINGNLYLTCKEFLSTPEGGEFARAIIQYKESLYQRWGRK